MTLGSQLLLAFAGALFGALLGGAIGWGRARGERRVNMALALFSEFHAPAFNHIRILAHEGLKGGQMPATYERAQGETKEAIASVIHFWEKVALLSRAGAIDEGLLARFFGQYARWWREMLCASTISDSEWSQTLHDIDWLFARLIRRDRRKGSRR